MSIAAVRLYHLVAPLPEVIGNALVSFDRRETLFVEVVSRDGLAGWGEAWHAPAADFAIVASRLAPRLLGQDPQHIGRLWQEMREVAAGAMGAVAAVDMALHDLTARKRGIPVSTLLGGAVRDRVVAYASGPFFKPGGHPYRNFEREVEGYLRAGFKAIKLRSGFAPADDAAIANAVRRLMGPDGTLMLDFNQSYAPRAALAAVSGMGEAGLLWVEEPAVPGDLQGYRMLSGHMKPALAGGETYTDARAFRPFLEAGCMDVLQPDIAVCGGLTGVGRVVALAELYDRPVVPHVWGGIVNFQAALHLTATVPALRSGSGAGGYPFLEFDGGPNPLLDLCGRPAINNDGTVTVPDGVGFGINLNADVLSPFIVARKDVTAA